MRTFLGQYKRKRKRVTNGSTLRLREEERERCVCALLMVVAVMVSRDGEETFLLLATDGQFFLLLTFP